MSLDGRRLLITGVITKDSIAFHVAERAQRQGAEVLLTSFGRARRLTERAARRLPDPVDVLELDVNKPEDLTALTDTLAERWGALDGALHAIAFAPPDALGGNFMKTPSSSAIEAFETSAFSLKALAASLEPLMSDGGSIVGMDFDAGVAWPIYDWMGVAKAALESGPRGSGSTSSQPGPWGRSRLGVSPGSSVSRSCGARRRRSGGTSRIPGPLRALSASCSRSTRVGSRVRFCTSTAAFTPSAPRRARRLRGYAVRGPRGRLLPEQILGLRADHCCGTRSVVVGHVAVGAAYDRHRLTAILGASEVRRRGQLVGNRDPGGLQLSPERIGAPAPVIEWTDSGAPDRHVGLTVAPGSSERVGDHNRGAEAHKRAQPVTQRSR